MNTISKIYHNMRRVMTSVVAALATFMPMMGFDSSHYTTASRLSTGKWVKVSVPQDGLYRITDDDARRWGFTGVANLRVYGYGGHMMSECLTADIPDDLPQLPVMRAGGSIVFWGAGPTSWIAIPSADLTYVQRQHAYATAGYYLITEDASVEELSVPAGGVEAAVAEAATTGTARLYHESELVNPGQTGRNLLGEDISSRAFTVSFDLSGRVAGTPVVVRTDIGSGSTSTNGSVSFTANGTRVAAVGDESITRITDPHHQHYYPTSHVRVLDDIDGEHLNWTVTYGSVPNIKIARLDFVTVNYERALSLSGGEPLLFGDAEATQGKPYRLSGTGSARVWDVTEPGKPVDVTDASGEATTDFVAAYSGAREYVAFNPDAVSALPSPTMVGAVANQNIHGEATPDMIILAPSEYLEQAQRIASLHERLDTMRVLVLNHALVFNEFNSGTPDVMAYRSLCKMFYDRGADEQGHRLRYLLLMGGATYDNRLVSDKLKGDTTPRVLIWQSEESAFESTSYCTDDCLGVLADDSGPLFYRYNIDIAVGRMPARSAADLRVMVDKAVNYMTVPDYGVWKNNFLYLADDEDAGVHMRQGEIFIERMKDNGGADVINNHLYIDAFPAVSQGAGRAYPAAREAFYNSLTEGQLMWLYIGHANPNSMTGNGMVQRSDFLNMFYYRHLPVLYAATCELARFDADVVSGGELLYNNASGGVAAMITTPRLAYVNNNGVLTSAFGRNLMLCEADGRVRPLGEVLRATKNAVKGDSNNSRYFMYGDPAMRLAVPNNKVVIDRIGDAPVSDTDMPVFKARQVITMTGHVSDYAGTTLTGFNGEVIATLFDSEQSVISNGYGDGAEFAYLDRPNKLSVVKAVVKDGTFTLSMTVPSEIVATYDNYSPSLINLYAYDSESQIEAQGSNSNFYIYGFDDDAAGDDVPPVIDYMGLNNSSDFVDGSAVNSSPRLIARVSDNSGINISQAGIGHNISITLDGTTTYSDVAGYYTPDVTREGEGGAGLISYKLSDLSEGNHTLRLRVWDVFNNSTERTISFSVKSGLRPEVVNVYATPSPASDEARFYITHNRPDAVATVRVEVYDLMGRMVWTDVQSGRSSDMTSAPVVWNLCDTGGRRVPRGIYVYRASLSIDGSREVSKARRIAVTAQ